MSERFRLEDLAAIVAERLAADADDSYTARLARKGTAKCAQKLGEEAVELAIAAAERDPDAERGEAADLLYHLTVLLAVSDVPLADVMAELERRTARSGLEEKAARPASA